MERNESSSQETETRTVRADDPELSTHTNERLTAELRDAVGADAVEVPKDRPHASKRQQPGERSALEVMNVNRLMVIMGLGGILIVAVVVALAVGKFWLLPVAFLIEAVVLAGIVMMMLRVTSDTIDRPSPSLGAAMSEEGVISPDHRFSEMVREYRPADTEIDGESGRETTPQEDPVTAAEEQAHSVTPSSQRSKPVGGSD